MTPPVPPKKAAVCKRCAATPGSARRSCDVPGCTRTGCVHLVFRKDGKDTCGPCNLAAHRVSKAATKATEKATEKAAASKNGEAKS